jgi:hypothetical protein
VKFYEWLSSQPDGYASLLRMYEQLRIPKSSNKLCKLLCYLDSKRSNLEYHGRARYHLKEAHRAYRAHRREHESRQFVAIAELKDIVPPKLYQAGITEPLPDDGFIHGLKRTEDITFTINFEPSEQCLDRLLRAMFDSTMQDILDEPPAKPDRWSRVYRRWGFKHRNKCAGCNSATTPMVKVTLGQLSMCIDGAMCLLRQGICPDCRGPAKCVGALCVTCDTCFAKNLTGVPLSKSNEQD